MKSFLFRFPLSWACYLAYFIGVSFQSGGIVHYSLDPGRYGKLIAIGAVIFVIGAISSDLISKESRLRDSGPTGFITFIASSLVLSIGVGMIGGSVQHFNDIPGRAPIYVGLGIVLSALGYHGRFQPHHTKKEFLGAMVIVSSLAIPSVLALRSYAASLPVAATEHAHGTETSPNPAGVVTPENADVDNDEHVNETTTTIVAQQTAGARSASSAPNSNGDSFTENTPPSTTAPTPTSKHDPSTHSH
jgi:hypothetical protein